MCIYNPYLCVYFVPCIDTVFYTSAVDQKTCCLGTLFFCCESAVVFSTPHGLYTAKLANLQQKNRKLNNNKSLMKYSTIIRCGTYPVMVNNKSLVALLHTVQCKYNNLYMMCYSPKANWCSTGINYPYLAHKSSGKLLIFPEIFSKILKFGPNNYNLAQRNYLIV